MTVTYGRTSLRQFAFFDPDGSCWRTWPAISLWGSEPYSATWPKRGTTRNGAAFERPMSALLTAGSGFSSLLRTPTAEIRDAKASVVKLTGRTPSDPQVGLADQIVALLPTPNASVAQDGEKPETWLARREVIKAKGINGNGMGMPLTIAVQLLPTPAAADGDRGPDYAAATREGTGGDSLTTTVARMLPTPTSSDFRGSTSPESAKDWASRGTNLPEAVQRMRVMSTPRASDGGPRGSSAGWGLRNEVRTLPAPASRDYKGPGSSTPNRCHGNGANDLPAVIGAITSPPSDDGKPSSDDQHPRLWTDEDD